MKKYRIIKKDSLDRQFYMPQRRVTILWYSFWADMSSRASEFSSTANEEIRKHRVKHSKKFEVIEEMD